MHVEWNAEIRTSSDFGQSIIVREQNSSVFENIQKPHYFVRISDENLCLKAKL